jgi:hypothetical protein
MSGWKGTLIVASIVLAVLVVFLGLLVWFVR